MAEKLSRETVLKVARLARLKLTDTEVDDYTAKLGSILGYVEQLNEVDTEDVEPMVHAVELANVFREDVVTPSLPQNEALANSPKSDGRFFLVPQIIEGA